MVVAFFYTVPFVYTGATVRDTAFAVDMNRVPGSAKERLDRELSFDILVGYVRSNRCSGARHCKCTTPPCHARSDASTRRRRSVNWQRGSWRPGCTGVATAAMAASSKPARLSEPCPCTGHCSLRSSRSAPTSKSSRDRTPDDLIQRVRGEAGCVGAHATQRQAVSGSQGGQRPDQAVLGVLRHQAAPRLEDGSGNRQMDSWQMWSCFAASRQHGTTAFSFSMPLMSGRLVSAI